MKLQTKLTLFNTFSKLVIVILFVLLLPGIIININLQYTDSRLIKQKEKVLQIIKDFGIESYISEGQPYGGYNLLKEKYISLDEVPLSEFADTIENDQRIVEADAIQ